jgi:hypothetical protein
MIVHVKPETVDRTMGPSVKGAYRPLAKGKLSAGGSIEIGDRAFAIAGDNRRKPRR